MNQKQSFGQPAQSAASGRTERVRVESDLTRVARSSQQLSRQASPSFRRPPARRPRLRLGAEPSLALGLVDLRLVIRGLPGTW